MCICEAFETVNYIIKLYIICVKCSAVWCANPQSRSSVKWITNQNSNNERSTALSGHTGRSDSCNYLCDFCQQSEFWCVCLLCEDDELPEQFYERIVLDNQSGEAHQPVKVMTGTNVSNEQNVEFMDQNPSWTHMVDGENDPSFGAADQSDADLGNFFSRPLKIFDVDWATTNANFGTTFNPWSLFFENPRVANRIANFNNLRCKLHLKFVINGNGFHYGRTIVSYTPLGTFDKTTPTRAFIAQDIIGASQKPHIYLDPTTSLGGEMVLPFFWYNNALRIPTADWQNMGFIDITAINQLKHANGATDEVRITCFAWAEDLVLSTPTNKNQTTLSPQSGEMSKNDEYGKPVSGPATALAKAAGALSSIPGISLYARASQLALSTIADVAAMFGYCRPAEQAPIVPYRPALLGNLPNVNVPDSVTKLTTDLKQETTVDPRTTGLSGVDEMSIKSIVTRESYLTKFNWTVASQAGSRLATFGVTPMNWDEFTEDDTEFHMTPACHLGCIFENWRGTMKYRFQIVSSNFHKGRLQIQYDPHDSADNEFNVAYNKVVDIAEEKDFTMEIGWGIPETYGEVMNPGISSLNFRNSSSDLQFPVNNPNFYNGQISIWVLNDLTVPNSEVNNDIQVNVFVSCGDDFEFANPTDENLSNFVWFPNPNLTPQSGEESLVAPDHEDTSDPSRPVMSAPDMSVGAPQSEANPFSAICFGESITSIRSLLKRYTLYSCHGPPAGSADQFITYRYRDMVFPLPRGYAPNGIHTGPAQPYNFVKQTLMGWFAPVFQGYRGGIRRKAFTLSPPYAGGARATGWAQIRRNARPGLQPAETAAVVTTADNPTFLARNMSLLNIGFAGVSATTTTQNPSVEAEIPYHSNYRFHPTRPLQPNANPAVQYELSYDYRLIDARTSTTAPVVFEYVAAADDFSYFFYTNVPVCYYAPSDPA